MLAFALAPCEDELLHSIVARHGALLGRQDAISLSALFFGIATAVVPADQPCRLEHAASMLGFTTGKELLAGHTAHHHDTAFATAARREAAVAWALRGERRLRGTPGIMAMALRPRGMLAFCDRCVASRRSDDVHPWLRAHQLPGTFVCHLHGNPLRATGVARIGRRGADGYAALTPNVLRSAPQPPKISAANGRVLLRYARTSAGLLQPIDWPDIEAIQDRLRAMLSGFRWERAGSLIAMGRLVPALVSHPNVAPLLQAMGVSCPEATWAAALNGLLYRNKAGKHPLLVLMLLEVVGAGLKDLQSPLTTSCASTAAEPVGGTEESPLETPTLIELCANPACPEMRLEEVVSFAAGAPGQHAACCRCGFAIRATTIPGGRPIVVSTCASWDAMVAGALLNPATSVRAASRRFGASEVTIMRAARRGGVWRPEWKDRPKLRERAAGRPEILREMHRSAWLKHASGSEAGTPIKLSPRCAFNAYRWLIRNDRAWLNANDRVSHSGRK